MIIINVSVFLNSIVIQIVFNITRCNFMLFNKVYTF